jgi:protoporphyrinogen oxidase
MSNAIEFVRFPPLNLLDKFRLAATIYYASRIRDWRKLESITVADWLRRWSGTKVFSEIWLPLLRSKLGKRYEVTSAAFIWATIARMYAARRTGLKKEMFGYVAGGYQRILERFEAYLSAAGVRLRLAADVREVRSAGGKLTVALGDGSRQAFDNVVVTAPCPVAARLCPELTEAERTRLDRILYHGIICASLLLRKPLGGYYVTNITDSSIPFTAVIEMGALVDRKHFDGNYLVYLPKYVEPEHPDFALSDKEIEERFLNALFGMYPELRPEDVLCFKVSRVRNVFAVPTLNYSRSVPEISTSVPGLFLVNSSQIINGTLNVNETVQLADRAVPVLLRAGTRRPAVMEEVASA